MIKKEKLKIAYVSITSFTDVDISFLKILKNDYDFTYYPIIPLNKSNYSIKEIKELTRVLNIKIFPVVLKRRRRSLVLILEYMKLFIFIKKSRPDIIFINMDDLLFNICSLVLDSKKCLVSIHDVENHEGLNDVSKAKKSLSNFGKMILIKKFTNFLTYSESQQKLLKTIAKNSTVYKIFMPLKDFGLGTRTKSFSKTEFLFFGNIEPYKGVDFLIDAVNNLSEKYTNFNLTIAGRSSNWEVVYKPLLKSKNVTLKIGYIENKEIAELFINTDYVVLPYTNCTQSGIIQIAYFYNVPIIASNELSFCEYVKENESGFLVDLRSDKSLYHQLENAVLRSRDEYNELRNRTKEFVKHNFSNDLFANGFNAIVQDVVSKASA